MAAAPAGTAAGKTKGGVALKDVRLLKHFVVFFMDQNGQMAFSLWRMSPAGCVSCGLIMVECEGWLSARWY